MSACTIANSEFLYTRISLIYIFTTLDILLSVDLLVIEYWLYTRMYHNRPELLHPIIDSFGFSINSVMDCLTK